MAIAPDFKKKLVLNSMILGVVVVSFGVLLYATSLHVSGQVEAVIDKRTIGARYFYETEHLARLEREAVRVAAYERQMELLLPQKDQMIYFQDWFKSAAKPYNVELTYSFLNDNSPTPDASGFITFRISARGSYDNVLGFLKSAESDRSRFLVSFDTLDFRQLAFSDVQVSSEGKAFYK